MSDDQVLDEPVIPPDEDEDALHPAPKAKCERCLECKSLRDNVGSGVPSWEAVRVLLSPAEFADFEGLTSTDEEHYAEMDGVLAEYHFKDEVECSFPGGHRHRNGIVSRMLCETVLRMGLHCARKYVVNFAEMKSDLKRRVEHQANLRRIDGWVSSAEGLIDDLERATKIADDVYLTMKAHLPSLFKVLKERRGEGPKGAEVDPKKLRRNVDGHLVPEPVQHLAGLSLLDGRGSNEITSLRNLVASYRRQEREAPPLDGPSAAALAKIAKAFEDKAQRLGDWLRECVPFTTEANLLLALVALRKDNPRVEPTDGGFRVGYFPNEEAVLRTLILPATAKRV
jgi:hypothetical protein